MKDTIRVRFAPSPTGHLHVGGARTALFNYLFAKSQASKATFVLRAEDTDLNRNKTEFLTSQLKDLLSLGITPDEGLFLSKDLENTIIEQGHFGPYKQSQRLSIYQEKIQFLLDKNLAYYCFLSDQDIAKQKDLAKKNQTSQQVLSPYRPKNLEDAKIKIIEAKQKINQGQAASLRFNTSQVQPEYIVDDLIRGQVKLPSNMLGDFVLQRSNGMPVYNFCCVVDDALMKISHVLRAEEHLSNTLRQLMLYEAFNFKIPKFAHMSLVLGEDKKKLSKRHGAASVEDYLAEGYLPKALVNFLCLLGWSHPESKEIFSLTEAAKVFDLKRLNAAPAVFDNKKLLWMNAEYIKKLTTLELEKKLDLKNYKLTSFNKEKIFKLCSTTKTLKEAQNLIDLIFGPLNILEEAKEALNWKEAKIVLKQWKQKLEQCSENNLTQEAFLDIQEDIKKTCHVKGKLLFMPIRIAVIGKAHGAELKELVPLIPIDFLIQKAQTAIQYTEANTTQ